MRLSRLHLQFHNLQTQTVQSRCLSTDEIWAVNTDQYQKDGHRVSDLRKEFLLTDDLQAMTKSSLFHIAGRAFQILMACVVIGMYGIDLNAANKAGKYSDSKWVSLIKPEDEETFDTDDWQWQAFAVAVGSMAAITALIYAICSIFMSYRTTTLVCPWDFIMVVLWAAVTGIFGQMYFNENPEMVPGVKRQKTAAAFDMWVDQSTSNQLTMIVSTSSFGPFHLALQ